MITLLNTSILTSYGTFRYERISLEHAKLSVRIPCNTCQGGGCPTCTGSGSLPAFESAIGHQSTAEILSNLLEVDVKVNRQNFIQNIHSVALVFKLKARAPEGVILTTDEINKIGYEFGLLTKLQ